MVVLKWRVKLKDIFKSWTHILPWKESQDISPYSKLRKSDVARYCSFCFVIGKYLGKVAVIFITILMAAVVYMAYWIGFPYWWERNPIATIFFVMLGHWLLLNIVFHYYMGVITDPGTPPRGSQETEKASKCKKCQCPRPPRTHHCSVCDRCILCMDHHCPWLNNCVGHFNARYFYLFLVYMIIGVSFLFILGFEIVYELIWVNDLEAILTINERIGYTIIPYQHIVTAVTFYYTLPPSLLEPFAISQSILINQTGTFAPEPADKIENFANLPTAVQEIFTNPWKTKAIRFMTFTCLMILICLSFLVVNFALQISRGETTIESFKNEKLRKKGPFTNPYDFGIKNNWCLFLGLVQGRTFIRYILWPSAYAPVGDGVCWHDLRKAIDKK